MSLGSALWVPTYARLLGARIGTGVDLHSVPPVTGLLELGDHSSVEPEVDLSGYWIDGDVVHVGEVRVGARARIGARSMLCPGADVGKDAEVAPGSAVFGAVPDGEYWSGSPAVRVARTSRGPWRSRPVTRRHPCRAGWIARRGPTGQSARMTAPGWGQDGRSGPRDLAPAMSSGLAWAADAPNNLATNFLAFQ